MGSQFLRMVLEFEFDEDTRWFADKDCVGTLIDVVLKSDFGCLFDHAGPEDEERPAKDAAAIRKVFASGKAGGFSALDAPDLDRATCKVAFLVDTTSIKITVRVGGDALVERAATALDTLDDIAQALISQLRPRGGLANGLLYVADDDAEVVYPRPRPPVMMDWGPMTQLGQYLDVRYHNDPKYGGTHPDIINALVKATVPAGVKRRERDQLVSLRWIDSMADGAAVGRALGSFEGWISGLLPVETMPGYNSLGDREDSPGERAKKAPFTFYDPDERVAYKAIMVTPEGEADDEVWAEQRAALKAGAKDKLRVRLIVPLRDLALQLRDQARSAGFDAVLYPDHRNRLWNPDPPGAWIGDIKPTPTPSAESVKKPTRKKR